MQPAASGRRCWSLGAACIDCAVQVTGGVYNSVDESSGVEGIGCWCVVVGEGVSWEEVELNR
jgi:hypothetical protein